METLYRGVGKLVYAFIMSYVGSKETAEDVLQETFLKLYLKPKVMTDKDNGLAYIMTIARNVSLNTLRKSKRQTPTSDEDIVFFGGQETRSIDEQSVINEALSRLTLEERKIFILSRAYGFTFKEVGQIVGMSVATVKRRAKVIKDKLKEYADE